MTSLGGATNRARTSTGRLRTPAERISDFLDRNPEASRSSLRSKNSPYDPTHSWDARSDNQNNNHNLKRFNKEVPTQHTRPISLIGSAVVLMEKDADGFSAQNIGKCVNCLCCPHAGTAQATWCCAVATRHLHCHAHLRGALSCFSGWRFL